MLKSLMNGTALRGSMRFNIAEGAAESAASSVEAVVESAVAQVEGALESAEARAEAAEELNETILESARRDALHAEIETIGEGLEECRNHHAGEMAQIRSELDSLRSELSTVRDQMAELANKSTTVAVSIPPALEPGETLEPAPIVAAVTINPDSASPAPMPESPVAVAPRGNLRRWA